MACETQNPRCFDRDKIGEVECHVVLPKFSGGSEAFEETAKLRREDRPYGGECGGIALCHGVSRDYEK